MANRANVRSNKGRNSCSWRDNSTIGKHNNTIMKTCRTTTDTPRAPRRIAIAAAPTAQRHGNEQSTAAHHDGGGRHNTRHNTATTQTPTLTPDAPGRVLDPPRGQTTHAQPPPPTNKARTQGTTKGPQPHTPTPTPHPPQTNQAHTNTHNTKRMLP